MDIIQWNIQSLKTHFADLKSLLNEHHPACICLQETLRNNRNLNPPSGYNIIHSTPVRNDGHERGSAIAIRDRIFYQELQLDTNLQVVAAKIFLRKTCTICSVYLPHIPVTKK